MFDLAGGETADKFIAANKAQHGVTITDFKFGRAKGGKPVGKTGIGQGIAIIADEVIRPDIQDIGPLARQFGNGGGDVIGGWFVVGAKGGGQNVKPHFAAQFGQIGDVGNGIVFAAVIDHAEFIHRAIGADGIDLGGKRGDVGCPGDIGAALARRRGNTGFPRR